MDNSFSGEYHSPQLVCKVEDKRLGFQGFLVIDTLLGGHCAGGVRVTPTVTVDEVAQLAHTMTKKFGFLNICMGGAKAGIMIPDNKSREERNMIFRTFGERLGFILRNGIYYPGTDIGTSAHDIELIEKASGIKSAASTEDNNDAGYFTALAGITAAKEIAKFAGIDFRKAKVGIEGFGKVGSTIADLITEETTIIGISTIKGAMLNNKGLDIKRLIEIRKSYGDDIVSAYKNADMTDLEGLIAADSNILFLCGKPRVLNLENVYKVKAKIVIGAGNLCFGSGVEEILYKRGIYVLPDFITSCGGVLGLRLRGRGLSFVNTTRFIKNDFAAQIKKFIELSWINHQSPEKVAHDIVQKNLYKMRMKKNQKRENMISRILRLLSKKEWRSLAAKIVVATIPKHYYHFPKIQELLLYQTREQFMIENELAD